MFHSVYKGFNIMRNVQLGHRLRWTAWSYATGTLAADTLAGIKELIRNS